MLSKGHDRQEILELHPYLKSEDIDAALEYAAWRAEEQEVSVSRYSVHTGPKRTRIPDERDSDSGVIRTPIPAENGRFFRPSGMEIS